MLFLSISAYTPCPEGSYYDFIKQRCDDSYTVSGCEVMYHYPKQWRCEDLGMSESECEADDTITDLVICRKCDDDHVLIREFAIEQLYYRCEEHGNTNCDTKNVDSTCKTCKGDYKLVNGACVHKDECADPNGDGTYCTCAAGMYFLAEENKCVDCPDPLCKTCEGSKCSECFFGDLIDGVTCLDPHCKGDYNGGCADCEPGYWQSGVDSSCIKCDRCTDCSPGDGSCVECSNPEHCLKYDSSLTRDICVALDEEHCLVAGNCSPNTAAIPLECVRCEDGWFSNDTKQCKPCSECNTNSDCAQCPKNCIDQQMDYTTHQCIIGCIPGHFGKSTGCISKCEDGNNCKTGEECEDDGKCIQCNDLDILVNGVCRKCGDGCAECVYVGDVDNGDYVTSGMRCLSCKDGYKFKTCGEKCTEIAPCDWCDHQCISSDVAELCSKVPTICVEVVDTVCKRYSTKKGDEDKCVECFYPSLYYITMSGVCELITSCTDLSPPHIVLHHNCVECQVRFGCTTCDENGCASDACSSDQYYYVDENELGNCISCSSAFGCKAGAGCKPASGCDPDGCPEKHFNNPANGRQCDPCSLNSCLDSCDMSNGWCDDCPVGTAHDANGHCKSCTSHGCAKDVSSCDVTTRECFKCEPSWHLDLSQAVPKCEKCPPECSLCYSQLNSDNVLEVICTHCVDAQHYLRNDQCHLCNSTCAGQECDMLTGDCLACTNAERILDGVCVSCIALYNCHPVMSSCDENGCAACDQSTGIVPLVIDNVTYCRPCSEVYGCNCDSDSGCAEADCDEYHYLKDKHCLSCVGLNCLDDKCTSNSGEGICAKCRIGYYLDANKKCIHCPSEWNCAINRVIPEDGSEHTDLYACDANGCNDCPFGSHLVEEYSLAYGRKKTCQPCDIPNCDECASVNLGDTPTCKTCNAYSYTTADGLCQPCPDPFCAKSALSCVDGQCLNCVEGYYLVGGVGKCTPCEPHCKSCEDDNGKHHCLACDDFFTLENQQCLDDLSHCAEYVVGSTTCKACESGYFLHILSNTCYPCLNTTDNCEIGTEFCIDNECEHHPSVGALDQCQRRCMQCAIGSELVGDEPNVECVFRLSNCVNIDGTLAPVYKCFVCAAGFYLRDSDRECGECSAIGCDADPMFCMPNAQKCLKCLDDASGNHYYPKDGVCTLCTDRKCSNCDSITGACFDACDVDPDKYVIEDGECVDRSIGNLCRVSDASGNCTACHYGHYLAAGKCSKCQNHLNCLDSACEYDAVEEAAKCVCDVNFYSKLNVLTRQYECLQCLESHCAKDTVSCSNNICTKCESGYFMRDKVCVDCAEIGCVPEFCSPVETEIVCTKCVDGFPLNGVCVDCTVNNCDDCDNVTGVCSSTDCLYGYEWDDASKKCLVVGAKDHCAFVTVDKTGCTKCEEGYYLDGNVCKVCDLTGDVNCQVAECNENGQCANCNEGYYLNAYTNCQAIFTSCELAYSACVAYYPVCLLACSTYSSCVTECNTTCVAACVATCEEGCAGDQVCIALCPATCAVGCPTDECKQTCADACEECQCVYNCIPCNLCLPYPAAIKNCDSDYSRYFDAVTKLCSKCEEGYYYNDADASCVSCDTIHCHSDQFSCNGLANAAIVCRHCLDGYFLDKSSAKPVCAPCQCPPGSDATESHGTCDHETGSVCLSCDGADYHLSNGKCVTTFEFHHCENSLASGFDNECSSCEAGYHLADKSLAFSPCLLCSTSILGCVGTCEYNGDVLVCNQCDTGLFQYESQCLACAVANCGKCNVANSEVFCEACASGYYLSGAACLACSDIHCVSTKSACNPVGGVCYKCIDGFYPLNGVCVACADQGCDVCDPVTGACKEISCIEPYTSDGEQCLECSAIYNCATNEDCILCKGVVSCDKTCNACADGFYMVGKDCISCSNNNCLGVCDKVTGLCSDCQATFALSRLTRTCVSCKPLKCLNDHCIEEDGVLTCLACAAGEFIVGGACITCDVANCDTKHNACALSEDETYHVCSRCTNDLHPSADGKSCVRCENCVDGFCNMINGRCVKCVNNHYPDADGVCQECSVAFCEEDQCDAITGICKKCKEGYFLYNDGTCRACEDFNCFDSLEGACASVDGICNFCAPEYFRNKKTNACVSCVAKHCERCSEDGVCDECFDGYYQDTKGYGPCKPCEQKGCTAGEKCDNSPTTCTESDPCTEDFILINGRCVAATKSNCLQSNTARTACDVCLNGYFLSGTSCKSCTAELNCIQCKNNGDCEQCQIGFFLNGTTCTACSTINCPTEFCSPTEYVCNFCGDGKYWNALATPNKTCSNCSAGCARCEATATGSTCVECDVGYLMVNGASKTCTKCSNEEVGCDVNVGCNAKGSCKYCAEGYYLEVGETMYDNVCKSCGLIDCHKDGCSRTDKRCTLCTNNKYPDENGVCQECVNMNCAREKCHNKVEYCDECLSPFYRTDNGKCVPCGQGVNVNCRTCAQDSSACLECNDDYTLINGVCQLCAAVTSNCKVCDTTKLKCVQCEDSYVEVADGICNKCAFTMVGCLECSTNQTTKVAECTACASGYVPLNGQCMPCATRFNNCGKCDKNSAGDDIECVECNNQFVLFETEDEKLCVFDGVNMLSVAAMAILAFVMFW